MEKTISLSNSRYGGTTTQITGYAVDGTERMHRLVAVDFCPKHPKEQGALWAELVSGTPRWLWLKDNIRGVEYNVIGIGNRYERLPIDVPEISIPMASNVRPKALRCFHPLCHHIERENKDADRRQRFYVLEWPNRTCGQVLASMMERDMQYPMLMEWGDALLKYGIEHGNIVPLITSGTFPKGFEVIRPEDGWLMWIGSAIQDGIIQIEQQEII